MKTKVKTLFGIMVIILFTVNWMYLSESKSRWGGMNPLITYNINPSFIGFKTSQRDFERIKDILDSAKEWFIKSNSRISYNYGNLMNTQLSSYYEIICDDNARTDTPQGSMAIYAEKNSDSDCTASSCVYIWSCNDIIVHADVQLNNSDFSWSDIGSDGDVKNLKTEILRAFGYAAGLGHCKTGERISDCQTRTGTDPDESSVMYKFPQIGKKNTIAMDDINGIQALYGTIGLPFPSEGKYALSYTDIRSIQEMTLLENMNGVNSEQERKRSNAYYNNLIEYNYRKTGKTLNEQYDEFYGKVKRQTPGFDLEQLKTQRMLLTQGILEAVKAKEDALKGYSNIDIGFIDYSIQKHLELRNYTIDMIGSK